MASRLGGALVELEPVLRSSEPEWVPEIEKLGAAASRVEGELEAARDRLEVRLREEAERRSQEDLARPRTSSRASPSDNGDVWMRLSAEAKREVAEAQIARWMAAGVRVDADAGWFVDGLDSFYDGTPGTNFVAIREAMAVIGVMGEVVDD